MVIRTEVEEVALKTNLVNNFDPDIEHRCMQSHCITLNCVHKKYEKTQQVLEMDIMRGSSRYFDLTTYQISS